MNAFNLLDLDSFRVCLKNFSVKERKTPEKYSFRGKSFFENILMSISIYVETQEQRETKRASQELREDRML